jgi:hypothetical protein
MTTVFLNTFEEQVILYSSGNTALGPQGVAGIQGYQGIQGAIGLDGLQGRQGVQGDIGLQGTQGFVGFGFQGVQGPINSTSLYYSGAFTNIISGGTGIVYSTTLNGAVGDCFILHFGVRKNSPGFPASTLSFSLKVSGSVIYADNITNNGDSTAGAVYVCIFSSTEAYAYELNNENSPNTTIVSAVGGNISVEASYSISGTTTNFDFLNLSIEKLVK